MSGKEELKAGEMSKQKELDESEEQQAQEGASRSLGKMGKIFLIAGIVLVQGAAAYTLLNAYYPEINDLTSQFESNGGVYYTLENVIINPANSNGERYLILSLTVELKDGSALSTLESRSAEVQDRINTAMSNFNSRELSSLEERDRIKKELGIVINEILEKKSVRNLFFTKYVLQ